MAVLGDVGTMTEQRDVVLVTVDSLRADHCGFMGYEADVTPTLDEVAEEGLVFEQAIAPAGTTSGSVPAFLTGEHPVDREWFATDTDKRTWIREHLAARETLPERLARRGYETAAFTANPWTSRYFGFDRAFDHFEDFMDEDVASGFVESGLKRRSKGFSLLSQMLNWWQGQDMFMAWEAFYDDVVAWLEEADSPYFLWIFLVDVHMPYLPGAGYRSQSRLLTYPANAGLFAGRSPAPGSRLHDVLVRAYDDTIRYTDAFVERLLEDLGESSPLTVVHADHGEEFGEHGTYGHGVHMHEADVHVPLVVANGPTGRIEAPFSLLELPELVTALAADEPYDHLTGPYATCRNYDPELAVRGRDWKYVWRPDGEALYDVADGTERPLRDEALADVGRAIVRGWRADDREKCRVKEAAADVAASGTV